MGLIVVDASTCLKWLLPEPGNAEAEALLREGQRLIAPELAHLEVVGAVLRRHRENLLSESRVREVWSTWCGMLAAGAVLLTPDDEVFDRAFVISLQIRHPLKDCLYLALAERDGAEFVTADRALHQRGKKIHPQITLIGKAA